MKPEDPIVGILILIFASIALFGIVLEINQPSNQKLPPPQVVATYKGCDLVRFVLADQAKYVHVLHCPK